MADDTARSCAPHTLIRGPRFGTMVRSADTAQTGAAAPIIGTSASVRVAGPAPWSSKRDTTSKARPGASPSAKDWAIVAAATPPAARTSAAFRDWANSWRSAAFSVFNRSKASATSSGGRVVENGTGDAPPSRTVFTIASSRASSITRGDRADVIVVLPSSSTSRTRHVVVLVLDLKASSSSSCARLFRSPQTSLSSAGLRARGLSLFLDLSPPHGSLSSSRARLLARDLSPQTPLSSARLFLDLSPQTPLSSSRPLARRRLPKTSSSSRSLALRRPASTTSSSSASSSTRRRGLSRDRGFSSSESSLRRRDFSAWRRNSSSSSSESSEAPRRLVDLRAFSRSVSSRRPASPLRALRAASAARALFAAPPSRFRAAGSARLASRSRSARTLSVSFRTKPSAADLAGARFFVFVAAKPRFFDLLSSLGLRLRLLSSL
mmetsp:Transcript_9852/g.28718  ORF Transcript_9852/g.28718 Transcript_9852/m.28718 type:complete len:436 (-) Transcript_9852:273-1580(-)